MTSSFYLECLYGVAFFLVNTLSQREQRIGFIEDCFQNHVQGRLDTVHESHVKRGTYAFSGKVVPKQTAMLCGLMALLVPYQWVWLHRFIEDNR